jgi:phage baseplate assembly protein W
VASLKLTSISIPKEQENSLKRNYLYKDVLLDLTSDVYLNKVINQAVPLSDIQVLYDIEAVKTSIANCFLTSPGQRILNPTYGIDLRRYLFEGINEDVAYFIENDIQVKLPRFEPRVVVKNVTVSPDPDNQQYLITLEIDVPSLHLAGLTIKNYLNKTTGYY